MKRRDLFKGSSLVVLGSALLSPEKTFAELSRSKRKKAARNIIFLVSDGMSIGTLNMADMLLQKKEGRRSHWLSLYEQNKVKRALMDTASANALVTDSAAASSSWGGGIRVPNGSLNVNADGTENTPIWQKFKKAGKSTGIVTTVLATHATPAGFCVTSKSRSDESGIAIQYCDLGIDVIMGGGIENFSGATRPDKRNLFQDFLNKGYTVIENRQALKSSNTSSPILGIFCEGALPYSLDRYSDNEILEKVPSLAEMTNKAINTLKQNKKGFVLQVEAGKVDWAAHANDISGVLYDQIAFDEAIKVAMDFAELDGETLVIITTDHGNSNPGLFYGNTSNKNFERIFDFKHTNHWILDGIDKETDYSTFIDKIKEAQGYTISKSEAQKILIHYTKLDEKGLYNPRNLPYNELAAVQVKYTSVGWGSNDHSADYVELAMYGPGSELLNPFVKNVELHEIMLKATELIE